MTAIRLQAPMTGWSVPLDEVPDAVFAERMMGEGLAIDPTEGVVRAPCEAEVIAVPTSAHAVTLRLDNGAELLIHVGLETVALGGAGFAVHVSTGQRVTAGDLLLSFDLDTVAFRAKSLISPIVVTNEGYGFTPLALDRSVSTRDVLAEVTGEASSAAQAPTATASAALDLVLRAPHGLHARPAARIAAAAKAHQATVELAAKGGRANARSPVAMMALGLEDGDRISLSAVGIDAGPALAAVAALIEAGFDDPAEPVPDSESPASTPAPAAPGLVGVCASPGLAVGPAAKYVIELPRVSEQGQGVDAERRALMEARTAVALRLSGRGVGGEIAAAHQALLDDPELIGAAEVEVAAGRSAAFAWRAAVDASAARLEATGNELLAARVEDLRDIERQVIGELIGETDGRSLDVAEGAVLIADILLPSQLMALDLDRIGGICTARGGPTSHVAIMAAAAGVPMLVAVGEGVLAVGDGEAVILDASGGAIDLAPEPEALAAARERVARAQEEKASCIAAAAEDCRMADGTRIEIFANLASADEAHRALAAGAEGCGLLRTEFLFHDRALPPSEDEQAAAYAEVARALQGKPLLVRTLDAGGDKPVPYLALPTEENPALGLRGVRLSLARPELLAVQLRAVLRAAADGDVRVMVPMIVDIDELRAVRAALEAAAAALGVDTVPLGIMVETPAAAVLAGSLAGEADFLSIGTNDLSQYALAADRGNAATADRLDALHPAVLRLIAATAEGACRRGKWLGICGGVASDPLASAILIGLGAVELSASPATIPALKETVRRLRMDDCRALAARALEAETAQAVRALAAEAVAPSLRGAA